MLLSPPTGVPSGRATQSPPLGQVCVLGGPPSSLPQALFCDSLRQSEAQLLQVFVAQRKEGKMQPWCIPGTVTGPGRDI